MLNNFYPCACISCDHDVFPQKENLRLRKQLESSGTQDFGSNTGEKPDLNQVLLFSILVAGSDYGVVHPVYNTFFMLFPSQVHVSSSREE